jgi:predicted nucleic acid-binding Zn ribbon protein
MTSPEGWRAGTVGWRPASLGDTLERFLKQMGAPPVKALGDLHERWPEVVGPALAQRSRPIEMLDGVLVIGCEDATWASQIGWMESQITKRCAYLFEGVEVRRVQLRIGR